MTGAISVTPTKHALVDFLTRGQELASLSNESVLVSLAQPLYCDIDSLALFAACKQPGFYRTIWGRPDKDFWLVGKGSAAELIFDGATSMDRVADKYHTLLKSALIEAPPVSGVGPIVIGGFRYDTQAPRKADWRSFPDARLVLPRFLFTRSDRSTWLTINTMVEPETDAVVQAEALIGELRALDIAPPAANHQPVIKRVRQGSPEQYARYVRSALQDIEGGLLSKVVLARSKVLYADEQFSLDNALGELYRNYPDCAVFAIENSASSFFGATPESLAHVNQGRLSLTCLAGSAARGSSPEEDCRLEKQLFESPKERLEHAAVAATVTASLKDLCRELRWDNELQILKLRNVQHLLTSVTGSLHPGNNILDVVKRLHPTPAVAGLPTDQALKFIRNGEGDRGWYAAPVGWIDHTGGGEFAVAIRSALLSGKRAILYAGAGIVKGSDPDREFQETELKFQPIMAALSGSQ